MSARRALTAAALFLSASGLAAQGTPVKPKTTAKAGAAATTAVKPAATKVADSTTAAATAPKKAMDSTKKHVAAKKHKPTN